MNQEENITLEKRKKALAELRDLKKPVEQKDIMGHAMKYDRIKAEREEATV